MTYRREASTGLPKRGFVLLAVLWILVGVAVLALAMTVAGREALAGAQNRVDMTRARWAAEGCLERARAAMSDVLMGRASWAAAPADWTTLDLAVAASPMFASVDCSVKMRPTGVALDLNAADEGEFRALFRAVGIGDSTADSLADALLDWRDSEDIHRAHGAERAWYEAQNKRLPRNAQFADVREAHLVRGFERAVAVAPSLDTLLTTEPGTIFLDRAPPQVLASLPGITPDVIREILLEREASGHVSNIAALGTVLPTDARDSLDAHLAEIIKLTARAPTAWIVQASANSGSAPAVTSNVLVRVVRTDKRAVVVRRWVWP